MKIKRLLLPLFPLLLTASCGENLSPEAAAVKEAKNIVQESYNHLLKGNYEAFLSGRMGGDELPADYREQLLTGYKQFMFQQQKTHGGINEFIVTDTKIDSAQHQILVFLTANYADSLSEEIVIPVIERDGKWKMK